MTTFLEQHESTVEQGTAADTSVIVSFPTARPTAYESLSRRAAALRDEVELTHNDVKELHHETVSAALDERTAVIAMADPAELLESLGTEGGLSWTTVARLVGVTPTAVRKWRRGEQITPQNRHRLARACALLEMLRPYAVADPASWLEMHISQDAVVTPVDLFGAGRADLIFELAGRRTNPHAVLDAYEPDWRTRYGVDDRFGVVEAPDGQLSIVQRGGAGQ